MKKIIINADDFGYSLNTNKAVMLGAQTRIITSCSLLANFGGFEHAVKEVLPQAGELDTGFHFNIMEGKSLTNPPMLVNSDGFFNRSWIEIMLKSPSKKFQNQLEAEFKAQLEKILKYTKVSHVDSHVHTHAIPPVFELVSRLSSEYKIPFIRTQREMPYKVKNIPLSSAYAGGCIKNILLNTFTAVNKNRLSGLKTNDFFIGVLYSGAMTKETILEGLKKIKNENSITEIIFHPSLDEAGQELSAAPALPFFKAEASDSPRLKRKQEFEITQDEIFSSELKKTGFELSSFSKLD